MWRVVLHPELERELRVLPRLVRHELLAQAGVLERFGPETGRPRVDTLNGSRYVNMKELRFDAAGGVWRVAFAFDPRRQAVLLAASDKSGVSGAKFYRRLIARADMRFGAHLAALKSGREQ